MTNLIKVIIYVIVLNLHINIYILIYIYNMNLLRIHLKVKLNVIRNLFYKLNNDFEFINSITVKLIDHLASLWVQRRKILSIFKKQWARY